MNRTWAQILLREQLGVPQQSPLHNLPANLASLVGRENELQDVQRLLQKGRLVSLVGPGGIGKTRLALQSAWENLAYFPHGVHFVSLAPVSSPQFLIPAIAEVLQFSFYNHQDYKAGLVNYLREKEMLLVMDNFEHLLPAAGLLVDILECAPGVRILTTSRERLHLYGEQVFKVSGLRFPQDETLQEIEGYSAVLLFLQVARRVCPDFSLSDKNRVHVARICRLVEGLPLAIELAAAWVRALSCQEIAQEIEQNLFDFLRIAWQDVPERHRSLRVVFERSWNLLTEQERQVFKKLAVFQGGFQREAAEHIAGASLSVLSSLVDKSFLCWNPSLERYELHQFLKQFGAEKLAQALEEQMTRDLHCDYYVSFLQQRASALRGRGQNQALHAIGEEIENVRTAWWWAVEHAQEEQIERCLEGLFHFYEIQSWFQEGEETFARSAAKLLQSGESLEREQRVAGKLLMRQGVFWYHLGRYAEARKRLQESLEDLRALGDPGEIVLCLINLARVTSRQGDYDKARRLLEEALILAQSAHLHQSEADSLLYLGNTGLIQGDYVQARVYYERALRIYREIGDRRGESASLNGLGITFYELNDSVKARDHYSQALQIYREIGDRQGESKALNNLGLVSRDQGDYARARVYHERALAIRREIGDRQGEGLALGNLGVVSLRLGDYARARAYYERALRIHREMGERRGEAGVLANLGLLFHQLGDDEVAQEHSHQALLITQDLGNRDIQGHALTNLGHALAGLGDLTGAAGAYRQALTLRRELGERHLAIESLAGLARLALAQRDLAQAQAQVEEILNYLQTDTLAGVEEPLRVYLTCYRVLRANEDSRAQDILKMAHNSLQEWAAKISDEELRHLFLERVIAHREILSEFTARFGPSTLVEPLTRRETQVLCLIATGLTNQEIADQLVLSVNTVKRHISNIYGKLGVRNRPQAITRAQELDLI